MIKRKIWLIIGIVVLIVGGAIALTTLTDSIKIEKVGYTIESWEKTKTYTKEELPDKINNIDSEIIKLQANKEYWEKEFYDFCISSCPELCELSAEIDFQAGAITEKGTPERIEECISFCPMDCEVQKELPLLQIDYEISELNKEKEILLEAIK